MVQTVLYSTASFQDQQGFKLKIKLKYSLVKVKKTFSDFYFREIIRMAND